MNDVCIIVPAYNEENRIGAMLKAYCDFMSGKDIDFRILVVLNNCHDNTLQLIKDLKKVHNEIEYLDFEKGGKGFAIMKGFTDAIERQDKLIGFVDADMATPPGSFYDLIKKIGNSDGAIASRWKKGATQNYPLK